MKDWSRTDEELIRNDEKLMKRGGWMGWLYRTLHLPRAPYGANKDNDKDNLRDFWHLRQWFQFWQLRTWIHGNFFTIKSDSGQHSQFLQCSFQKPNIIIQIQTEKRCSCIFLEQTLFKPGMKGEVRNECLQILLGLKWSRSPDPPFSKALKQIFNVFLDVKF